MSAMQAWMQEDTEAIMVLWWHKDPLPESISTLIAEIESCTSHALLKEALALPEAEAGAFVSAQPLPSFMQKLVAVRRQLGHKAEAQLAKQDLDAAGDIHFKREFMQHMLSYHVLSIPRPPEVRWNFGWRVCRDFRVCFWPIVERRVPVHGSDAAPHKVPVRVEDSDEEDEDLPPAGPKKKKLLH